MDRRPYRPGSIVNPRHAAQRATATSTARQRSQTRSPSADLSDLVLPRLNVPGSSRGHRRRVISSRPSTTETIDADTQMRGQVPTDAIDLTDSPPPCPAQGPSRMTRARSGGPMRQRAFPIPSHVTVIDLDAEPTVARDVPASLPLLLPTSDTVASHAGGHRHGDGHRRRVAAAAAVALDAEREAARQAVERGRALMQRQAMHRAHTHAAEPMVHGRSGRRTEGNSRRRGEGLGRSTHTGGGERGRPYPMPVMRAASNQMNQVLTFFGYPQDGGAATAAAATAGSGARGQGAPGMPNQALRGYLTTPYGGGPVPIRPGTAEWAAAIRAATTTAGHVGFVPPDLDYGLGLAENVRNLATGFAQHLFGPSATAVAAQAEADKYIPPEPCKEPFTRTLTEEDYLVCPSCSGELGSPDAGEQGQKIWITKCGHVYCGPCANKIVNTKVAGKKGLRCQAPGCVKALSKSRMFEAYV